MYDEWLTDRSREARELSKFSLVCECSAKNRVSAIGIYYLDVQRAADDALAQHAGQSSTIPSTSIINLY